MTYSYVYPLGYLKIKINSLCLIKAGTRKRVCNLKKESLFLFGIKCFLLRRTKFFETDAFPSKTCP